MGGATVGFDLDMTLIDSRPGIAAVYQALSDETGVYIDVDTAVARLGPPLDEELARWFPADQIAAMGERYRAIYPSVAVGLIPLMSGAAEAIESVHTAGGRVIVITAKFAANAQLHLDHAGLDVDEVIGWAYGNGKRDALLRHRAAAYIGDHVADMRSVVSVKATMAITAVGVETGPCDRAALLAAGADVVLPDLRAFDEWFLPWESDWVAADVSLA